MTQPETSDIARRAVAHSPDYYTGNGASSARWRTTSTATACRNGGEPIADVIMKLEAERDALQTRVGGAMTQSDKSDSEVVERSEFGRGVVICLAKFSEHLANEWATRVRTRAWWDRQDEANRARQVAEAHNFPRGDAARRLADLEIAPEIDGALRSWANAASDHFFDLDRDRAPGALVELADLTLSMGHGFGLDGGGPWTVDHWRRIHALWQQACEGLDQLLGAAAPDWGQW